MKQKFWYPHNGKPPRHVVHFVFGHFWPKILFIGGGSKTFGTLISGNQWGTFLSWKHWPVGLQLTARNNMCNFDPKTWIFGAKGRFFVLESGFLSTGHITSIPGATTFPFRPPQQKFPFPSYGSFFGDRHCFWPFGNLNFGRLIRQEFKLRTSFAPV